MENRKITIRIRESLDIKEKDVYTNRIIEIRNRWRFSRPRHPVNFRVRRSSD
jgi:hypothetical protein